MVTGRPSRPGRRGRSDQRDHRPCGAPAVPALAALAIGGLQLRHTLAAARGERPRGWQWTGLALLVLVYLPMVWFTWDWAAMQWFVVASALMLLRGWPAAIVAAAPVVATSVTAGVVVALVDRASAAAVAVGRERLRVSRDLHDLLGQSLSAVSLKGDLALRLLPGDPSAARAEIQGLTGVAR